MIVPMQRVALLCTAAERERTLIRLRDLGVLHADAVPAEAAGRLDATHARLHEAEAAIHLVREAAAQPDAPVPNGCGACDDQPQGAPAARVPPADIPAVSVAAVLALGAEEAALEAELDLLARELERLRPFGDFDPAAATALTSQGIAVTLFCATPEAMPPAADGALVRILSQDDNHRWGVQIAGAPLSPAPGLTVAPLPERSLSTLRARRLAACRRHAAVNRILAAMAPGIDALLREQALRGEDYDSATVQAAMGAGENVVWLTGYTPDERLASLRDAARRHGWGLLARKPRPDEEPPTLLRPPRIFRPIAALFSLLGIVPGYREADISIVFYAFFTLFFAMLVGDAGYGVLLLLGTLWARRKWRQAPAAPLTLSTVFAVATIGWGILTATYFGIPATALPALLNHRLSRWLADQSNIMQLCFALGAVHLSIARLWNAIVFYPSRKALAQLGWLGIIWNMYCVACLVVVPGFVYPPVMFWLAGLSVLLIAGFMLDRSELKTQGVELAMLPLTIIGSLGDVISYVRLFAVGMAGVKVAENFNGMALGLPLPLWLKIPAMLLILLLGHGLNLAMGGLSILVHAVRLNTLEFSTHKGITWAGFAYRPFKRRLAADAPAEA